VYHLRGIVSGIEICLRTNVSEEKSELPTVVGVWRTANWHEREIYDLMGIRFRGHPDLRRILMWEGYPYHPLRKDFPLAGKPTDLPGVAFTRVTPMEGGPFVTVAGGNDSIAREPRVRIPETDEVGLNARVEARGDNQAMRGKAFGPGPIEKK
jgi:NADH-quinone oxidoreductase subunit C